jgi:hypothetical protein
MQKTSIYIDISTRSQITESGSPVDRSAMFPAVERGQWQVMCYTFVTRTESLDGAVLTPVELDSNAAYVLVADDNFDDDDNLMLKSYQSVVPFDESDPTSNMFNIPGDWIDGGTADMSLGQLSIRVNSDTVKFATVLGDSEVKSSGLYQCIKQFLPGISNPSTISWIKFRAVNTVRDWSSAQTIPPAGVDYIAYINAYMKNMLEYQYSSDGVDWHDTLTPTTDLYFQMRISGIGADWSHDQTIPYGPPNTLSIGTVTDGASAGAEITGASPNQTLNLILPKGDQGIQGPANSLSIGTVEGGDSAGAEITGTAPNQTLNLILPKGDQGTQGPANTLTIGTVTDGASAGAEITGTSPNQTLNLILPKGDTGADSTVPGPANTLSIGVVTAGDSAGAEITGASPNQTLNLTLPKGDTGAACSLSIGTVVSGDSSGAEITGTAPNQVLNLTLQTGATGPANTLTIGTVDSADSAGAEITGTAPNQVLNLTLPKGDKGDTGGTFSILQVAELPEIVDSSTLYLIG